MVAITKVHHGLVILFLEVAMTESKIFHQVFLSLFEIVGVACTIMVITIIINCTSLQ
jgi:hypothetical protein